MPRDMHPPPPLPKNLMKVHTAVVWIAAAAIRSMSYHRDQYQSFLQSTPHDSDWERREYSRRTNILDEERRGLAATPYEDVRMYVTSMSSIVRQYSHSSLSHTRVRALHSAAATKVILRTVIPRLGSARDRVLQDVKALLEETASDPFIALVLLVLPGRNALTLLTQPGPTSDLWSGQSMSVEDYKAAVSELESWTFPERWVGFTSTAAPIERERRPYKADFSSRWRSITNSLE
ncbi:hypothetical protein CPB85DRAFT_250049 [Mucidula mucida]|nr:hypothetical protein CPB85DRAFT_250049 [Mucidula mucida]